MLLRTVLMQIARRAAADPRVRAKAREVYETQAKPMLARKAQQIREVATETDPRRDPARFAGRVVKRLIDG